MLLCLIKKYDFTSYDIKTYIRTLCFRSNAKSVEKMLSETKGKGHTAMSQIYARAEAILNARPEAVYNAIADYKHGHPHIIPQETFSDLRVEQGGYGAGTVIRFKVKVVGMVVDMYQRISEPEPGHVLVEQDIDSPRNTVTTFTVTPVENHQKAHVIIATTMNASAGLAGLLERLLIPRMNQRIYRKELRLLEAFAQKNSASASSQTSDATI